MLDHQDLRGMTLLADSYVAAIRSVGAASATVAVVAIESDIFAAIVDFKVGACI